MYEII